MTESIATDVRIFIYDQLIGRGFPPAIAEIADRFGMEYEEAKDFIGGMKIGKTLVPHPVTGEIWMAGPFSAAESQYRVTGSSAAWWANCGWDMFGVAMIVDQPVRIDTHCTDCGEPWTLSADPHSPPHDEGIVHFLLPARKWYEDIGFT